MMHRKCAAVAIQHCPSLKRDVENGTLMIRQVLRYRVQCAIMSPEYVESETGEAVKALGHAQIELLAWRVRGMARLSLPACFNPHCFGGRDGALSESSPARDRHSALFVAATARPLGMNVQTTQTAPNRTSASMRT